MIVQVTFSHLSTVLCCLLAMKTFTKGGPMYHELEEFQVTKGDPMYHELEEFQVTKGDPIRESVDSLCGDGTDAQYMQYLSKSRITLPQTR